MTKEALKLALEALESCYSSDISMYRSFDKRKTDSAITAIKEALAQPEHGWTPERIAGMARLKEAQDKKLSQRTWVGLTKEEFIYFSSCCNFEVVDEIEKLLQRKNT